MGDELINKILAGEEGNLANDLLVECFQGFPVQKLRPLLSSNHDKAVKYAVWILSELGVKACPLVRDVVPLLSHSARYVKFFALDVMLMCATSADHDLIARTIGLVRDHDSAVRWKAFRYLSIADYDGIVSALRSLEDTEVASAVEWIINTEATTDVAERIIADRLISDNELERMAAVVAASRLGKLMVLAEAAGSTDSDVAQFAKDELDRRRRSGEA